MKTKRQTVRITGKVGFLSGSIPGNVLSPETAAAQCRMAFAERNHFLEEAEDVLICLKLAPIEPSSRVVLVIRIVVAKLRVQELVSRAKHRSPVRQHEHAEEILHLPASQGQHFGECTFVAFVPAVPAVVVVHAILIVLSVGPVVFFVVRNDIVQSETVVRGDVVHALVGMICIGTIIGEKVVTPIDPPHQVRNHAGITFDETTYVVAKPSVPLQPRDAREPGAELISARIPGLRDQPQLAQFRISGNFGENGSMPPVERSVGVAAEH